MAASSWIICFLLGGIFIAVFKTADGQTYNFPQCEETFTTVTVLETLAAWQVLKIVNCSDVDTGPAGTITYTITAGNGAQFYINRDNGKFYNRKKFNADFVKFYPVTVEVRDQATPALTTTVKISVYVTSVNDNAPVLKNLPAAVSVREDAKIGTKIAGCTIYDGDFNWDGSGGLGGIARVEIKSGNTGNKFAIDSQTCDIYVQAPLNYEWKKSYLLMLIAQDLDPDLPTLSVSFLTVNVLDVNDREPWCAKYMKVTSIPESTPAGTVLASIPCFDKDTGSGGQLVYSSIGGNTNVLDVVGTSNAISLVNAVDADTEPQSYELLINISDRGVPALWKTASVMLYVEDVDDNPPVWTSANPLLIAIPESTDIGTSVGQAETTDADITEQFKNVTYGVETAPVPNRFDIDPGTGVIYVTGPLDRETQSVIEFDIFAYSSDKYSDRITSHVKISLTDVNDVAPIFSKSVYTATLTETDAVTTSVAQILAQDPDEGLGGDFVYSIAGSTFNIDSSGLITLAESINNKDTLTYIVTITATDKGTPSLTSQAYLQVTVVAVNEFAPTVTSVPSQSVLEDAAPGTELFVVTATDGDSGHDGMVRFSLGTPSSPFMIDSSTGSFKTWDTLDRESVPAWDIVVVATDQSQTSPKSTSITVHIDVDDVNDNAPSCDHVPAVIVPSGYTTGDLLATLVCSDGDQGINGQFTFSLSGGNVGGVFSVTSNIGSLSLVSPVDRSQTRKYTLSIDIVDKGNPVKTGTATIVVVIGNENVNTPTFPTPSVDASLNRNAAIDHTVATVTATDPDAGVNGEIVYSITGGNANGDFLIDKTSGDIRLAWPPQGNIVNLVITAADKGTPSKSGTMTVNVFVNPTVPSGSATYTFTVLEGEPTGTAVGVVSGSGGTVGYTIKEGNFGSNFQIVKKANGDGEIQTTNSLDREQYAVYELTIEEDLGAAGKTSVDVLVHVGDVNDNPPVLQATSLALNVVEMSPVGTSVGKVIATDQDVGSLSYEITPVGGLGESLFSVDPDGTLRVRIPPDFETTPSASFKVVVKDDGTPQRFAEADVAVTVVDVAETITAPSTASSTVLSAECATTAATGSLVLTLTPVRFGLSNVQSGSVRYITMNNNGVFDVNEQTGAVTVRKADMLYRDSRYIMWVICEGQDLAGSKVDSLAILRIDTFVPNESVFVLRIAASTEYLALTKAQLLNVISQQFPSSHRVGIYDIRDETSPSTSRRKLLATQSVVLMYVVADTAADGLGGIQTAKTFLSQTDSLQVLQLSGDGTPVLALSSSGLLIELVMPYEDGSYTNAGDFLKSPEGIAVIVLVVIVLIVIIIFTVLCCLLLKKKRKMKQHNISQTPKQDKKTSIPFKKFGTTTTGISLISPVAPASTAIPPIKELETSSGSPPPPYHISSYQSLAAPKPTEVKEAGISSTATPPMSRPKTQTKQSIKPTSTTKSKAAPKPPENADKASLNDHNIEDVEDIVDASEPVQEIQHPRKNRSGSIFTDQPIIVEGKTFDGIGFNEATQKPYVYSTKTGEVLNEVTSTPNTGRKTPNSSERSAGGDDRPEERNSAETSTTSSEPRSVPFIKPNLVTTTINKPKTSPKPKTNIYTVPLVVKSSSASDSEPKPLRYNNYLTNEMKPAHHRSYNDLLTIGGKDGSRSSSRSMDSGLGELPAGNTSPENDSRSDELHSMTSSNPSLNIVTKQRLSWHGQSSIPRGASTIRDAIAKDPFYSDWAKGLAQRGKHNPKNVSRKPNKPTAQTTDDMDVSTLTLQVSAKPPPHLNKHRFSWLS